MRLPRTAALPAMFAAAAALLLFAGAVSAVVAQMDGVTSDGAAEGDAERFVQVKTIYRVGPGDHLHVTGGWSEHLDPLLPHTRVLVVEGGEGRSYLHGGTAQHVLLETRYPPASTHRAREMPGQFGPLDFRFVRPDVYDGKPHVQGLNGDLHDAVDIVILAERPSGMSDATWDAGAADLHQVMIHVEKADDLWVHVHVAAFFAAALAFAGTLAGLIVWLRSRRMTPIAPSEDGGVAALVSLQTTAADFLGMLRTVMRLAGGLLAVGGIGLLVTLGSLLEEGLYTPYEWLDGAFMLVGLLTWLAGLLVWGLQYRRIAREVRRWSSSPAPI